jgi:photosystem II stability/assembly factor-like uncharacterized protein
MNLNEPTYSYNNVIKFKNDSLGLFMGDNSIIMKTEDIGETRFVKELELQINIKDLQFVGDSAIYAVGDNYIGANENLKSNLIKSLDNGETWDSIMSFKGKQLYSLWFFNNDSGIIAGYDGIYRTIDASDSWDTVWSINQFGYKYGEITQLSFPYSEIGYAIGYGRNEHSDLNFDYFLLKSKDSGVTWDTIKTFPYPLTSIHFLNQDTGFIGTENGRILKTINGGPTWLDTKVAENSNSVYSMHFISNMIGFAAGAPGVFIPEGSTSFFIAKTIDGGDTWECYDTIGIPINSIYYINDTVGFISGSNSLIMKSSGKINGLPEDYPWYLVGGDVYINQTEFNNSQIKIYPNPTNGILFIQQSNLTQNIKKIELISAFGAVLDIMKPTDDNDVIQVDLSGLVSGMYLLQLTYTDRYEILKILKK